MAVTDESSDSHQSAVDPHFPDSHHRSPSLQASTGSPVGLHSNILLPEVKYLQGKTAINKWPIQTTFEFTNKNAASRNIVHFIQKPNKEISLIITSDPKLLHYL